MNNTHKVKVNSKIKNSDEIILLIKKKCSLFPADAFSQKKTIFYL